MSVEIFVKTSLLVLIGLGIARLMQHRSAAWRCAVWQVVMLGLLVLPFVILIETRWHIFPVLLAYPSPATLDDRETYQSQLAPFEPQLTINSMITDPAVETLKDSIVADTNQMLRFKNSNYSKNMESPFHERSIKTHTDSFQLINKNFRSPLLAALWITGVLALALREFIAVCCLKKLEADGILWHCPSLIQVGLRGTDEEHQIQQRIVSQAAALATQLGIRQSFSILFSNHPLPMVYGLFSVCIALPKIAIAWDAPTLRSVLLHELSHVKRHDVISRRISRIAFVVHWFNPLVWLAIRCLDREQERACDDCVLGHNVKPSDYAAHLLQLASNPVSLRDPVRAAIGMAGQSQLRSRLSSILQPLPDRTPLRRSHLVSAFILFSLFLLPFSLLGFSQEPSSDASQVVQSQNGESGSTPSAAKQLYQMWWQQRRYPDTGSIPGGLIVMLAQSVEAVLDDRSLKLAADQRQQLLDVRKVMDGTRDWQMNSAKLLLNSVEVISPKPIELTLRRLQKLQSELPDNQWSFQFDPQSPQLSNARWSQPGEDGVRTAILHSEAGKTDGTVEEHVHGTVYKCKILFHNTGEKGIVVSAMNPIRIGDSRLTVVGPDGQSRSVHARGPNCIQQFVSRVIEPNQVTVLEVEPVVLGKRDGANCIDLDLSGEYLMSIDVDFSLTRLAMQRRDPLGYSILDADRSLGNDREKLLLDSILCDLPLPKKDRKVDDPLFLSFFAGLHRAHLASTGKPLSPEDVRALITADSQEAAVEAFTAKLLASLPPSFLSRRITCPATPLTLEVIDPQAGMAELIALFNELSELDRDRRLRLQAAAEAKNFAQVRQIQNERAPSDKYVHLMKLASAFPGTTEAFESAMFILKTSFDHERQTAMDILVENHSQNPRLDEVISRTNWTMAGEDWAKRIMMVNSSRSVLAHCKWRMRPDGSNGNQPDADVQREFYQSVIRDFGDMLYNEPYWGVPRPAPTFRELATKELLNIEARSRVQIGLPLPDFSGVDIEGKPIALSDYRGQPTLIVCWATWCGPCLELAQMERRLLHRYREQGLQILGICCDFDDGFGGLSPDEQANTAARIHKMEKRAGIAWRSIRNALPNGKLVTDLLGSSRLPKTFLLDSGGVVRHNDFIDGLTSDPVAQESHFMDQIERVLGVSPDRTDDLALSRQYFLTRTAQQRYRDLLLDILDSIEQANQRKAIDLLVSLRDDNDLDPDLRPHVIHFIAICLNELKQAGKELDPKLMELGSELAALASQISPKYSPFLATLSKFHELNGNLEAAITAQRQAVDHSHPCYRDDYESRLEELLSR